MKYYKFELIEKFRRENKLGVEEFCKKCKIAMQTYYKIKNQLLNVRASAVFKIAKVINCNMYELYY